MKSFIDDGDPFVKTTNEMLFRKEPSLHGVYLCIPRI